MNVMEHEMIDILNALKGLGCVKIKAEFEAEGTRMEELMRLKDVTCAVGLPIVMKIGGAESVTDVYHCLSVGVASIVAPMVETPYALYKYEKMIDTMVAKDNAKDIDFYFNMETITAYENFPKMMETPLLSMIQGVTIGRVDLAGSLGCDRSAVDGPRFLEIARNTFSQARAKKLKTAVGGAISAKSLGFLGTLRDEGLIDNFETRKVVFMPDAIDNGETIFKKALEFELLWLKSKRRYHSRVQVEDEARITMLEKRLNG